MWRHENSVLACMGHVDSGHTQVIGLVNCIKRVYAQHEDDPLYAQLADGSVYAGRVGVGLWVRVCHTRRIWGMCVCVCMTPIVHLDVCVDAVVVVVRCVCVCVGV